MQLNLSGCLTLHLNGFQSVDKFRVKILITVSVLAKMELITQLPYLNVPDFPKVGVPAEHRIPLKPQKVLRSLLLNSSHKGFVEIEFLECLLYIKHHRNSSSSLYSIRGVATRLSQKFQASQCILSLKVSLATICWSPNSAWVCALQPGLSTQRLSSA